MKDNKIHNMVLLAILAAISYVIVCLIRVPVVGFLSYEPKDVIIVISGFLLGPMSSFVISLAVSLLEMVTVSDTGLIGAVMNLLSTCSFACTAAFLYKRKRTLSGAIIGLIAGSVTMAAVMLLWNWLITPLYMGISREAVEGMLLPMFLPFNLLKAGLNTAFTLLLYKPMVTAIRKNRLLPEKPHPHQTNRYATYLLATALLLTCLLALLALQGKL